MMNDSKKITLKYIAEKCNVSVPTVSRVLSNANYPINSELRTKILDFANKVGYHKKNKSQITNKLISKKIGIIIPSFQNPFFSQIIMGAEVAASELGFSTIVLNSQRNKYFERDSIKLLLSYNIKTLMLISVDDSPEMLETYLSCGGNACVLESNFISPYKAITAQTSKIEAGSLAVQYLVSCGHTRIAFATAPLTKKSRSQTLDGCSIELSHHGLSFADDDIFSQYEEKESHESLYEFDAGKQLAESILNSPKKFTAIIAVNDMIACGIIQALAENHVRVPQDISVIGFDNIFYSSIIVPSLTTVDTSSRALGQKAAQILMQSISSPSLNDNLYLTSSPQLIIRNSVRDLTKP